MPERDDGPTPEMDDILESTLVFREQPAVVEHSLADRAKVIRSEEYYRAVMERFRQEKDHRWYGRRYKRSGSCTADI
jgi:hypothetical protein